MLKKAEASHGETQGNIEAKAKSIAEVQELIASLRESMQEKETLISEANEQKRHLENRLKTTRASHNEKNQAIVELNAKVRNPRCQQTPGCFILLVPLAGAVSLFA